MRNALRVNLTGKIIVLFITVINLVFGNRVRCKPVGPAGERERMGVGVFARLQHTLEIRQWDPRAENWVPICASMWDQNPRLGPGSPGDRAAVRRDLLSGLGDHPTCRTALFLVKRRAARRASPILQATRRADPPSTAHLGTRELP